MSLLTLRYFAVIIVFTLMGAPAMRGQAAVEYGTLTSNIAGVATSVKPPDLTKVLPGSASSAGSSARSSFVSIPTVSPEEAAKANRQFFLGHAGPDAAQISLHTAPDHAAAWIDGKYIGPAPLDLKLAPGHHQLLVRAPNMQESIREFDVTAKQTLPIELTLKSGYQSGVTVHWPSKN